jgi:hypothetical protein
MPAAVTAAAAAAFDRAADHRNGRLRGRCSELAEGVTFLEDTEVLLMRIAAELADENPEG